MATERLKKPIHAWLRLAGLAALAGCATPSQQAAMVNGPDASKLGRKPSLYIVVERDKRLPVEFTAVFKQLSQQALRDFRLAVSEGSVSDKEIGQSDWVMTVRATRVIPNFSFKPFDDNALNGVSDCALGSALAIGLLIAPCKVDGDTDFLEASIRDANGKTLKTYAEEAAEGGFTSFPPLTYLTGRDQNVRWEQMIHELYDKISADRVLASTARGNSGLPSKFR